MASKLKKIGFFSILAILIGVLLYIWACSFTYSEGTRSGHLVKLSKKGVIFKTYEVQMNLGGLRIVDGLEGNIWDFSIIDEELIDKFQKLEGKRVKVYYKERYKSMPWLAKTNYIAYKIEALKD